MIQSDIEKKNYYLQKVKGKLWLEANILVEREGKKIYDKYERKNLLAYFSFACIKEREGGNGSRADDFVVK